MSIVIVLWKGSNVRFTLVFVGMGFEIAGHHRLARRELLFDFVDTMKLGIANLPLPIDTHIAIAIEGRASLQLFRRGILLAGSD